MPHHEYIQTIYKWVFDYGDPSQGENPELDYLQKLNTEMSSQLGINMDVKELGWVHKEILTGRWRPHYHY